MRTQEEIKKRFTEADDMFGTQQQDLIVFLSFETAKEFLKPDYVNKVIAKTEVWEQSTDAKAEILKYLSFAYRKARDKRGLSAGRSMLHFKTWIWLDDATFYDEIENSIGNYTDYGISVLDKISKKYGYDPS